MSKYVDNFIKKHKEYFKTNKSFIESNSWDNTEKYKNQLNRLKEKLKIASRNLEGEELEKKQDEIAAEINKIGYKHNSSKKKLFEQENDLTNSITKRLKKFIEQTEKLGDRRLVKVQKFIDFTVNIINIHLQKCEDYRLNKSSFFDVDSDESTEEEIELSGHEIRFRDLVFTKQVSIEDILDSLNVYDSSDSVDIEFYGGAKASLILRKPLISPQEYKTKDKIESLAVDWNVATSKEMFINMKQKDIPKWNPNKHFFDQDPVTIQFWVEEFNKISKGITINGYFVHPWLYFHLNFFKTPIPTASGEEDFANPGLRDNEWFFVENLKNCKHPTNENLYAKAMLVYGTRRFGKSVILASLAHWRTLTKYQSYGTIVGGSSSDLVSLTNKIQGSMNNIALPFKLGSVGKQNWDGGQTNFGIKKTASDALHYSSLIVQNLEGGTKKSATQKTAGLAPSVSIYDEIGKYPFLKPYKAALPSFKTPYGWKCVTVLAGTGGEADLSTDAMAVLSDPEGYELLPMNWDLLENKIDPEYITWERRTFATFFPGQMAYEDGFIKKKEKFGDFLEAEERDELNKLEIETTNWEDNKEFLEGKIEHYKKSKDSKAKLNLQQQKVQYPIDPKHCFASGEDNKFPVDAAMNRRDYLEQNGIGEKVFLHRMENGSIDTIDASNKELAPFPYNGGFFDAPIIIYERPHDRVEESSFLYIAGLDDYNLEESDGDSLGSFCIYKRNNLDDSSNKIVAMYNARPDPHGKFHKQGHMLLEMYNAKCYMENADTKFKDHLDLLYQTDEWLVKGFDHNADYAFDHNSKRKYGWQPTDSNIKFMMGRLLEYCHKTFEVVDETGKSKVILGVELIDDIGLLSEIISYTKDGNFDRLRSFGSCLMYDHWLTSNYISASIRKERPDDYSTKPIKRGTGLFPDSSSKNGFF